MKKLLLTLFLSTGFYLYSFCQDILVFKNRNEIKVKISEILPDMVKYKKWDNLNGPLYTDLKSNIFMIKYKNGSKDVFANKEASNSNQASVSNEAANKNISSASKKISYDTKIVTLTSPTYTFGDIAHLTFKDYTTQKEKEYEWHGVLPAINEIMNKCEGNAGCPALKGQSYTVTLKLKLMDMMEYDGESGGMKATGKKEKRWVIIDLKKISSPKQTSGNTIFGEAQKFSLPNNTIWSVLYPGENKFDNYQQLIRKVSEDGTPKEYRTAIQNTFYYKSGNIDKAAVILFSYEYVNAQKLNGHVSTPKIDVAKFVISNGKWVKQKIVEDWKISQPGWGEGPKFQFKKLNNINCLYTTFEAFVNGRGNFSVTEYYNIETLKEVKGSSKKISD